MREGTGYTLIDTHRKLMKQIGEDKEKEMVDAVSADDFFTIFLYVIFHSQLTQLEVTKTFILGLCDRKSLNGEAGYYLTAFEAAIEYIKDWRP
jgi:hypothetical protein